MKGCFETTYSDKAGDLGLSDTINLLCQSSKRYTAIPRDGLGDTEMADGLECHVIKELVGY